MSKLGGHDLLTGLPNRLLLRDRLVQALAQARRQNGAFALIQIELGLEPQDNPLRAGGRHDSKNGWRDRALQEVAALLHAQLRASDTIARIDGGFAVILADLSHQHAATMVARKILDVLDAGLVVEGRVLQPHASLGIALFPAHGDSPEQLLQSAGAAAAHARAAGGGLDRLASPSSASPDHHHDLSGDLQAAIEQGQLRLEYQPQIDLRRDELAGFEALLRWHHPTLGDVAPEVFVEIAETSGQIGRIGRWALAEACTVAAGWPVRAHGPIRVAVNFSTAQMAGDDLPRMVAETLAQTGLPAARLELELTEQSVLEGGGERVLAVLTRLRAMGVHLALDDFGTGYASLRHLGSFPLDALKIDRSFVAGLHSPRNHAIVRSLVELAHRMGLRVTAEGVETRTQLDTLRALDCDEAQGHALGKPLTAVELAAWLAGSRGVRRA
jgi:diguanylate cyclase (GGDEF)-like protein